MMRCLFITALTFVMLPAFSKADDPFLIAAYLESWARFRSGTETRPAFSPEQINPGLLTDLYLAFALFGYDPKTQNVTGDFRVGPLYADDPEALYPKLQALRTESGGKLRLLFSIGGAHFNDRNDPEGMGQKTSPLFSKMIASPDARKQFIASAIQFAHTHQFQGIDIDWEYPGDLTRGGSEEDFTFFPVFLKECREALSAATPPLLLSVAAPASVPAGVPKRYLQNPSSYFQWWSSCTRFVDRLTVMAYDYHIPSESGGITGANAPLYQDSDPKRYLSVATTLEQYLQNGTEANKILLGIPLYGRSYSGVQIPDNEPPLPGYPYKKPGPAAPFTGRTGWLANFEIQDLEKQATMRKGIDLTTSTAYGYIKDQGQWISYDTPITIRWKVREAKTKGLLGILFWAVDLEDYGKKDGYSGIQAAHDEVKN